MNHPKINIAVDGYSSCGKSTLAKALAHRLGYTFIDSGAMYRSVTLHALRKGVNPLDVEQVTALLPEINLHFEYQANTLITFLNHENVEGLIRTMEVSSQVSHIAVIPEVRRAMVAQQQAIGRQKGVVMDGRDIGTVVFPDAELKIFMVAAMETRVQRRFEQLQSQGKASTLHAIRKNLFTRDYIDSTRSDSPLKRAVGAVTIDNTYLTEQEQLAMVDALVQSRLQLFNPAV
ncbi:MAG: (d)CMP kinase [Bacteroidota bacterium]